jgi:hypothetical protein
MGAERPVKVRSMREGRIALERGASAVIMPESKTNIKVDRSEIYNNSGAFQFAILNAKNALNRSGPLGAAPEITHARIELAAILERTHSKKSREMFLSLYDSMTEDMRELVHSAPRGYKIDQLTLLIKPNNLITPWHADIARRGMYRYVRVLQEQSAEFADNKNGKNPKSPVRGSSRLLMKAHPRSIVHRSPRVWSEQRIGYTAWLKPR